MPQCYPPYLLQLKDFKQMRVKPVCFRNITTGEKIAQWKHTQFPIQFLSFLRCTIYISTILKGMLVRINSIFKRQILYGHPNSECLIVHRISEQNDKTRAYFGRRHNASFPLFLLNTEKLLF